MDCGQVSFVCDAQQLLTMVVTWVADALRTAVYQFNLLVDWIRSQLKELIAIGGFAFAVWKWLRYRDSQLFLRFRELLEKEERRLRHARTDLLEIVCRPTPGQSVNTPLFAEEPLRQVFRKRRWERVLNIFDRQTRTDRKLDRALAAINEQIEWCEKRQHFYREQRSAVHLLKGAMASARSERAGTADKQRQLQEEALAHFNDAIASSGNDQDISAVEYKAHQLRKLGEFELAHQSYEEMEELAEAIDVPTVRSMTLARAKRYQAEMQRILNPAPLGAYNLLGAAREELAPHAPVDSRYLLEKAEVNEMQACVGLRLGYPHAPLNNLREAEDDYRRLVERLDPFAKGWAARIWLGVRRLFHQDSSAKLHQIAQAGWTRVKLVRSLM